VSDERRRYPIEAFLPAEDGRNGSFDPDADPLDPALIARFQQVATPMVRYFRTEIEGIEHLPWDQGCLCIGNHAVFGIDSAVFFSALYARTGRMMRGLAEHIMFRLPVIGDLFVRFGAVDGTRENAVRLLQSGQWAICYPGGSRDSFKTAQERYQLKWHGRLGYLRCALQAQVPLVPVAAIGVDDAFITLGRERFLGRRIFGKDNYDLPIFIGLGLAPLPVKFRFVIAPPLDLAARFGLSAQDALADEAELLPVHAQIWSHTQALIDRELARRTNRFF
jgi:1-acyl-sn-glycerol-3-phosphate acyltransferase